jgi:hypothetical protein
VDTDKFRGKRIDNGEWIEGALIRGNSVSFIATMLINTLGGHEILI